MECDSTSVTAQYVPPPLGNGQLSVMLDYEGAQRQQAYPGHLTPMIWWAGRRYESRLREYVPFGYVEQDGGAVASWRQSLEPRTGSMTTACVYADGRQIDTEAFVHLEQSVLAFRKTFTGSLTFHYTLAQPGTSRLLPKRMQILPSVCPNGVDIAYTLAGQEPYHGVVSVLCDRPAKVAVAGNRFSLTVAEGPASFYLLFVDSMEHADVLEATCALKQQVKELGYDGLFAGHCQAWAAYWDEAYVRLPSAKQSEVYLTAQYHLRISATPWSIPTGIFGTHWHGRYFGFDEHFSYMALASSGHLEIARRVPAFRYRILDAAVNRAFRYFGDDNAGSGARYHWETDEQGEDCTPSGFWLEHIFHMANIALSSWYDYRFTGDREFLASQGYPVISRCADFYRSQAVYQMGDGRVIVGKCTDLERLGPARENAFMTTCGVIATFTAAADAAAVLGKDGKRAAEWRALAEQLRENLPEEDGHYVPYPGCPVKSIAVFAGTFPYPALPPDDPRQLLAIDGFMAEEKTYGNMYPVGNSVCVWYAGWMGIVFARLGRLDRVRICIDQAVAETNCFHEIFEISQPVNHPWFTTAEGTFVQMVNESLVQSAEDEIRLLPPPEGECAYKLPAWGGVMVEATWRDGNPERIVLHASQPYVGRLVLPDGTVRSVSLSAGEARQMPR